MLFLRLIYISSAYPNESLEGRSWDGQTEIMQQPVLATLGKQRHLVTRARHVRTTRATWLEKLADKPRELAKARRRIARLAR